MELINLILPINFKQITGLILLSFTQIEKGFLQGC